MAAPHGIVPIDLVVVNLYQFEKAVAKPGLHLETPSRTSDIAAPRCSGLRQELQAVTVVVDPLDYPRLMARK